MSNHYDMGMDPADERDIAIADRYDEYDEGPMADWYCDHDVPNGCSDCATLRREREMLDSMGDDERQRYLYGCQCGPDGCGQVCATGTFETYFAPGGPAWQKEQKERRPPTEEPF